MLEHVPVLLDTISLNTHLGLAHVQADALEWGTSCMEVETWDVILGSDIVYEPKCWDALLRTIRALSCEETTVIIAHRPRHEDDATFWDALKESYIVEKMDFTSTIFALAVDVTIYTARLRVQENKVRHVCVCIYIYIYICT